VLVWGEGVGRVRRRRGVVPLSGPMILLKESTVKTVSVRLVEHTVKTGNPNRSYLSHAVSVPY
jgi:hypothetical protein